MGISIGNRWVRLVALVLVAAAAILLWNGLWREDGLPEGFASGNGRIEAIEIDIAAKAPGRVADVLVGEGDLVTAGQTLARIDTAVMAAQLREAQAEARRARIGVETASSHVAQREAERNAAEAVVAQRKAEFDAAEKQLARTRELVDKGTATLQRLDEDRARYESARAAVSAANAQVAAVEAAQSVARSEIVAAEARVEAADATVERIAADIDDSVLRAPRDGRVQYRVAEPGEVVPGGGVVLNMVDLTDVYMTFFLPTEQAGRTALGAEARLVFDAAPQYVVPAEISFVADVAQFTPKTVETEEERQKLMFRVKARIAPALLQQHLHQVKTGLPGMAYVRLDRTRAWPAELAVRLPQ